jgi:plastin-1
LNTDNVPLLSQLKNSDEDLEAFKKINDPEHYLLRWINYHLKNAGSDKEVKNFGSDLKV